MSLFKTLLKDTALYGLPSIVGRFLNYLLIMLHTAVMPASSGQYGVVTNLYAYTALILVLLTFGMETTFFRYANKEGENPLRVYSVAMITVSALSAGFLLLVGLFLQPLSLTLGYADHPEYLAVMAVIVAIDSISCLPFAYLRYQQKARKFACLKMLNICVNILLNLFVFLVCPILHKSHPGWIAWFYDADYLAGYVFAVNLITSLATFVMLMREWMPRGMFRASDGTEIPFRYVWDGALFRRMFKYSYPVLVLGLAGILNQTVDKILYPYLVPGLEGKLQLGIYGACFRIAMIVAMFTQAFRFAFEPIIFNRSKNTQDVAHTNALGMKYFIIASLLGFLAVMALIDVLKGLIIKDPNYWEGLVIVPIVMVAEIMMGIYFNLSFWYKLIDQTLWGALFSAVGCVALVLVNLLFVPQYGYVACAWGGVAAYGICMLLSYFVGQKKNPIPYDLKSIGLYVGVAAALYAAMVYLPLEGALCIAVKCLFVLCYLAVVLLKEVPPTAIQRCKSAIAGRFRG